MFDKIGFLIPHIPEVPPPGHDQWANFEKDIVLNFLYSLSPSILICYMTIFDKIGFLTLPYPPSTTPRAWPFGQIWKILYLIPLLFKPFNLICYMTMFDKIGYWTPLISPKYHPQGMTQWPNLKNIVFNFFYSSSPSIWYATWPCLTKLDIGPPLSPRAWPMGQILKILYLISSSLQALPFDMLHDHIWQNFISDPPPPPPIPPTGDDPRVTQKKPVPYVLHHWVPDCVHKILYF